MRIAVVGAGYVGLVTGACFAHMGHNVHCVDVDGPKIEALKMGLIDFFEPQLEEIVWDNLEKKRLCFTGDLAEALSESEICFIAVGTPMDADGGSNLNQLDEAAQAIGRNMRRSLLVVNKSTAPVGAAKRVAGFISEQLKKRGVEISFQVVSNPEFLREGSAVSDCLRPERIVIGSSDQEAIKVMKELYAPFIPVRDRLIIMDSQSAEMSKYASNAMLATRISFMNEMAGLCEKLGADVNNVRLGMGTDSRIGPDFLYAGCGYGGSCFSKDIRALLGMARGCGAEATLIEQVEQINERQKRLLPDRIKTRFGHDLSGRSVGVWGLSFKPDTDDMRQAPSLVIVPELLKLGAQVQVYDPKALNKARKYLGEADRLEYVDRKYKALTGADALVLLTEWHEFSAPDFARIKGLMKTPIIFDGRNQYNQERLAQIGFEYWPIGLSPQQFRLAPE